ASPALIERVRSVVTNESGAYRLTDLRPGVYSVTFTLPGFRPLRREGIELTTDFTATVNVTLGIGDLQETVVVSGQSPTVDLQSRVQANVLTSKIVDAAPTARTMEVLALALVPGMVAGGLARPT